MMVSCYRAAKARSPHDIDRSSRPPGPRARGGLSRAARQTIRGIDIVSRADTGHLSDANITYCAQSGVDAYISVGKSEVGRLSTELRVRSRPV